MLPGAIGGEATRVVGDPQARNTQREPQRGRFDSSTALASTVVANIIRQKYDPQSEIRRTDSTVDSQ